MIIHTKIRFMLQIHRYTHRCTFIIIILGQGDQVLVSPNPPNLVDNTVVSGVAGAQPSSFVLTCVHRECRRGAARRWGMVAES